MILGVICFGFRRVSLAEYIRVLRVYPTLLQVMFSTCWWWWLTTGGLGDSILTSHLYAFVGWCHYASNIFGTYINV